jgi:hypothetical protein
LLQDEDTDVSGEREAPRGMGFVVYRETSETTGDLPCATTTPPPIV